MKKSVLSAGRMSGQTDGGSYESNRRNGKETFAENAGGIGYAADNGPDQGDTF